MRCGSCGTEAPEGARYCPSCGHELVTPADERRVATVLFADLVGFTSLAESRDPEQVKLLVDRLFQRLVADITTFGGRVDKIVGDAIVALFGAPTAHEDDAERAVRAALRMQETLGLHAIELAADVRMRIGINTGEVLVGSLRAGGDYTAMGDVVNTASRLQAAAPPGAVVVGPATYAATNAVIQYERLGELDVRGRDEMVEAWRAVAALLPPGHRPRRAKGPLVGREHELAILRHALGNTVARNRASLILITGEAGVGKNRLAEELTGIAREAHSAMVLSGRCVPYGEANVWWPLADAIRSACNVSTDDPLVEAQARIGRVVASGLRQPPEAPEVVRVTNGLLHLLGHEGSLRSIDPARAREEAGRSVYAFTEAYAQQHPIVIRLTDLHWADDPVLQMIDALVTRLADRPIVLVATCRPELVERWRPQAGRHTQVLLALDTLDRLAASELLDSLFGEEVAPEVRDLVLERSGGNPFFMEEMAALVESAGSQALDAGAAVGRRTEVSALDELPDTLRGLVAARIDRLTPAERLVLQDAAVLGRSGPVSALVQMSIEVRGRDDALAAIDGLVAAEILNRKGPNWSFRSNLVRDVAYSTLTKADRATRHAGIADFLEAHKGDLDDGSVTRMARHYRLAAELEADLEGGAPYDAPSGAKALQWVEEAAIRADQSDSYPRAADLYGQALELCPAAPSARRLRLLLGRTRVLAEQRKLVEAHHELDEATEVADSLDEAARVRVSLYLGDLLTKEGRADEARETLAATAVRFESLGDRRGMAEALRLSGMVELFAGSVLDALEPLQSALAVFEELGDRRGKAWALQNLAWIAFVHGRPDQAEERLIESARTFEELGDTGGLGWANGLLGYVRMQQGDLTSAGELAEQTLTEARARGDRWGEAMMQLLVASVRMWTGRTREALRLAEESAALFRSSGGFAGEVSGSIQAAGLLGRALLHSGRVDDAFDVLEDARNSLSPDHEMQLYLRAVTLVCAAQVGEGWRAAEFLQGVEPEGMDPARVGHGELLVGYATLLLQDGSVERSIALLERVIATSSDGGPGPWANSVLGLALAGAGRASDALDSCREVERDPRATYLDRADALCAAGLAHARGGDIDRAAAAFSSVRTLIDATEDQLLQARVRLAEAFALEAIESVAAEDAMRVAKERTALLGITADGLARSYRAAAGVDA